MELKARVLENIGKIETKYRSDTLSFFDSRIRDILEREDLMIVNKSDNYGNEHIDPITLLAAYLSDRKFMETGE